MSFSQGLSGLSANAVYLDTIGNNLANINTIGYKASAVSFMDLVSQTIGGTSSNPMQVGLGVTTGSISPIFSQGAIENTREATNAAIQGNGFFVVNDGSGNAYTRAGNFSFDSDGALVTPDGYKVQGWTATNAAGDIDTTGSLTDIIIPPGVLRQPTATSSMSTVTNLDSDAAVADTYTDSVQIVDSLGASHVATILYTKTAASTWSYEITVPATEATGTAGTTAGTVRIGAVGSLTFNGAGAMTAPIADVTLTGPTTWADGATVSSITWDLINADGDPTITSFAAASATSSKTQNGSAAGMIDNISIKANGSIVATLGAGQTVTVGQLALASFNNPKGLVKLGSSRYGESQSAGIANIGVAGTGGRGSLIGSALEQSNVDIAQEFTRMILAQRGYQANSKTITTSDELLLETLNLKR